jgi:large subunit ribosomal protein L25
MAEVVLAAEVGRPLGSRAVRRLRREGKIPGVIYGHGTEPLPVAVGARELRVALNGEAGANQLLSLDTGSDTYLTVARDMQRHPVAQTVTHVDFVIVRRDEVISADVPITLVGEATEVHHGDGLVDQQMFTLPINAVPANIPDRLEADISDLTIGGQVRVSDLTLPDGVTTDVDPDTAVAIGQPPRVVALEEEAEAVEGEGEGEEAAAVETVDATGEAAGTASSEEG